MKSRIGKTAHVRGEELVTCEEVITFLLDYLAQELLPDEQHSFERHLAICPSCAAYLATYSQAVHLGREALRQELEGDPPPLESDLVRAILQARV